MPDKNIKKNIILKKDLPNVIGDDTSLNYEIRYRMISEDKNRLSHWSPINILEAQNTEDETGFDPNEIENTSIPNNVLIKTSDHTADLSWTMPSLLITNPTLEEKELQKIQAAIKSFDVYVQWREDSINSDWVWVGTSDGTKFSINYPPKSGGNGPDYIKFAVQKITQTKERFNAATYLETDFVSL
jgi:hypothetical protein